MPVAAQDSIQTGVHPESAMPSLVRMIGDDEVIQSELNTECADILVQIEGLTMRSAYTIWLSMLSDLETFASKMDYDIKGVKLWLNVYWHPDGSIRQIIFYPKPNSRNIDFKELSTLINNYAQNHNLPVTHSKCFSHYGSASFPTFYDQLLRKE